MEKDFFTLKGIVHQLGEPTHIQRGDLPDIYKRVLTVETYDGQVLYPELRNSKMRMIDTEGIQEGSAVEIYFTFQGSEKNGKRYNNIYIYRIKKL